MGRRVFQAVGTVGAKAMGWEVGDMKIRPLWLGHSEQEHDA